jgi:hypothetical protein
VTSRLGRENTVINFFTVYPPSIQFISRKEEGRGINEKNGKGEP